MKIIIITILVLGFCQFVYPQNSFFKTYKRPSQERAFSSVQMADGSFIITGEMLTSGYFGVAQGYIAKVSSTGEIVNELLFNNTDVSHFDQIINHQQYNADFLCIGANDSIAGNDTYGRIVFYGLDQNFDTKYHKKFAFSRVKYLSPWQCFIANDSILYLANDYYINNTKGLNIIKYHMPFDSLSSYSSEIFTMVQDMIYKQQKQQLDLYVYSNLSIVTLNENLEYISSEKYSEKFPSNFTITPLGDTNFLLSGTAFNLPSSNQQLGCIRYNLDDISVDSLFYTPSADTNFYGGSKKNTAISGNNIFITGIYNVHAIPFPYNYNSSWVTITKLDIELNVINTYFYGGDAQYCPFSIIPTSDGGCFVTGYSYDYINNLPNNNYELDIFVLKVNSDGLVTEIGDSLAAIGHNIIIYPNPGIDYLILQSGPQITGAEIYMFDIQGKPVLKRKINNSQLNVNTAELAPGTYPYQIVFKNTVIESGKWVKK